MKTVVRKESDKLIAVVSLSDDEMKLFVEFSAKDPDYKRVLLEAEDLLNLISPPVAKERVDIDVLRDIAIRLGNGEVLGERRIAKGLPPVEGSNGKALWLVKPYKGESGAEQGKGDKQTLLNELHLFDNVTMGAVVGRVYPPSPGTSGHTALGKPVHPPATKPVPLKLDKSLQKSPSHSGTYEEIKAQVAGVLVEVNGEWKISETLRIPGDLDLRFGNIDFVGAVEISGSVSPSLIVKGEKGVKVSGNSQHATLSSTSGPVVIDGFVTGDQGGQIVATKGVSLAIAHKIVVESGDLLTIKKEALDCTLRAQGTIDARSAQIAGGRVFAVQGLDIGTFGNEAGLSTDLMFCSSIEATSDFTKLISEITSHAKAINIVELHLGPYAKNASRVELLKEPLRSKIEGLLSKRDILLRSLEALEKKKAALNSDPKGTLVMRVNVRKVLYPGVTLRAGSEIFAPNEPVKGPVSIEFNQDTNIFEVKSLQEFESLQVSNKGGKDGRR